ncbi:MAG: pseudouridine-5'-phosphate glycosidase [Armatimonadota bacterium]|nr:pseudouridine-5'-phosphate glycosidase [bacterium]
MQNPLDISHEISSALNRNQPVVALESSVIAQGLPSPANIETALAMEQAVKNAGAMPATIGVIDGKIRVGLTEDEIKKLAEGKAAKLAVRDIPYSLAKKIDGGTTVSATARIATIAGIPVMATGGIGGVHRGASDTFDISADLWELARTPILVVCSGAKAVLDIHATAEWLETHGVPVYGYGTTELPAFYSTSTGISIPKVDDADELAEVLKLSGSAVGARCAAIIAVPVPQSDEVLAAEHIEKAIHEASEKGIKGKQLTPYLLNRVGELTDGKSTKSNISLLINNAKVAAEIACALNAEHDRRMGFVV